MLEAKFSNDPQTNYQATEIVQSMKINEVHY